MNIKITGSGSYIPEITKKNEDFANNVFIDENGSPLQHSNDLIIEKFKNITGIEERRYAENHMTASDIAFIAAEKAISDSEIDPETLDYIILAHNFGDVKLNTIQSDAVPSLAARVKSKLRIKNPNCVAYDILFGCPGWIEGVLQANAYIKSGMAKKCLVIGAETLSRVVDIHDRDSMIYSDGAGATIIESTGDNDGILAYNSATYALDESEYLYFGSSYNKAVDQNVRYIKMHGRKIYEFALNYVPNAMKTCLEKSAVPITNVKKILIHQANEKMDEAIIIRFFKLYGLSMPHGVMPMSITHLGNSSVATIPTLYDLLMKGQIKDQQIDKGDVAIFASVGAGMNINSFVYRF